MHSVCHIITKLELGGAQQNTLFTVAHLDRRRFRPILVTGESGMLDADGEALAGVDVFRIPTLCREITPTKDVRTLYTLTILLKRMKPDIVHTHSSKAGILGRIAARLAGVPVIVHTIHGFGFTPFQSSLRRRFLIETERAAARVTTRFISVSEANCQQGMALGLFSHEQCVVIRSGVDLQAIRRVAIDRERTQRALGLEPGRPVVGMVAPMKPQKSPVDFVRVAAAVHDVRSDVAFLYVGDGELRARVESEAERLGVRRSLRLLGWRRDVWEILRCLDVFVLTSLWEGLPRVYLEALASGVPVVGTRVDGAEEVIRDGENGYLCSPGDVAGIADRVLILLNNEWLRQTLSARGAATLTDEFDIWQMVRRQEEEYDRLLGVGVTDRRSSWKDSDASLEQVG